MIYSARKSVRRHALLCFLVLLACAGTASAQDWARKMFTESSHDFGNVARGSKAVYHFKFTNIYEEPAHIASVRSSCGCTSVDEYTKSTLKTWDTGDIVADFNTNAFLGVHSATITVTFDKPFFAEVQLQVSGNIHGDLIMQPGLVELGTVNAGQTTERKVTVTHTGRSNWAISDVRSANTNFEVEVNESMRNGGTVAYDLLVRLKPTAPIGYVKDRLFLVTNDASAPQVPVEVEGQVVADVEVRPSPLVLGTLTPGQSVPKNLVVLSHSKRAFKILGIECDDCITYKLPEEAKDRQIIPITFTAGKELGKIQKTIKIKTDLGDNVVPDVICQATIVESPDAPGATTPPTTTPVTSAAPGAASSTAGGVSNDAAPVADPTNLSRAPTSAAFRGE